MLGLSSTTTTDEKKARERDRTGSQPFASPLSPRSTTGRVPTLIRQIERTMQSLRFATSARATAARKPVNSPTRGQPIAVGFVGNASRTNKTLVSLARRRASSHVAASASSDEALAAAAATTWTDPAPLFATLDATADALRRAPISEKFEFSKEVAGAVRALGAAGALPTWGAARKDASLLTRRTIGLGDLRMMGIKAPEQIAIPGVRNDLAFLVTVVGVSSVAAVLVGQLPGDWGGFGAYLIGGIPIVVLAIGSTAPGLLSFFTDKFSRVFPDYRERVRRHEAAHFLVAYLLGLPVTGYSLDIGAAHVDVAEADLERRLIEKFLEEDQVNVYAVSVMAGVVGEATKFETVEGQTADLMDLQKVLNRTAGPAGSNRTAPLTNQQQQNATRWAAYTAGRLLKNYAEEYEALQAVMGRGGNLVECIQAIEKAAAAKK